MKAFQKLYLEWVGVGEELLPLLVCDTFEVLRERDGFTVVVLLR